MYGNTIVAHARSTSGVGHAAACELFLLPDSDYMFSAHVSKDGTIFVTQIHVRFISRMFGLYCRLCLCGCITGPVDGGRETCTCACSACLTSNLSPGHLYGIVKILSLSPNEWVECCLRAHACSQPGCCHSLQTFRRREARPALAASVSSTPCTDHQLLKASPNHPHPAVPTTRAASSGSAHGGTFSRA
jgi:hypothetical protein